jgi:uncharacterized membrane protein YfcA
VRATFSGFAFFDYGFRLLTFLFTGLLLQWALGIVLIISVPAMAAGLYIGNHIHHRISNERALQVIGVMLVLSGLSLVIKVLWSGV